MGKIIKVAYFQFCGMCHLHGRVILSSGEEGREVSSRGGYRKEIRFLFEIGQITEEEFSFLKEHPPVSLPDEPDPPINIVVVEFTGGGCEDDENPHKYIM